MASSATYAPFLLLLLLAAPLAAAESPTPAAWPLQFHSILYMNYSGSLSLIDLWYDWTNGRNVEIIQPQLGSISYNVEWNNGTSFIFSLDSPKTCSSPQLEVGILPPDWLHGAEYLGQEYVDGFLCNVWQKLHFVWYYEDVVTVHWVFYTGRSIQVMTFEVGAVLEEEKCQAPVHCFDKKEAQSDSTSEYKAHVGYLEPNLKGILGGSMLPL